MSPARTTDRPSHPLWSGTITFGIVTIPVHLMPAVHEHAIHFHQISRSGRGRIHYKKVVNGKNGAVEADDIVKGYEVAKNRFVTFKDDEIKRLMAEKKQELEITEFIDLAEIDPRFFNHLYYLTPGKNGAKPYQLLQRALQQAQRVGITRLVMHNKEHVAVLRSLENILALQTLHFADEIILPDLPATVRPAAAVRVTSQELGLAAQLIATMSGSFRPGDYKDDFTERVKRAIARKAKGKPLEIDGEPAPAAGDDQGEPSLDLMAALDRSLGMHRRRSAPGRRSPRHRHEQPDAKKPHQRGAPAAARGKSRAS